MIAKISHASSLYGSLIYNHEKLNEGTARIISGNRIISGTNEDEINMRKILFSFEPYLAANNRTKNPALHISLNPAVDDRLTDEQFAALAKDYREKMGYGNQPYLVYMHEDIDRRHIHIVSVCVDENGRKIDDSFEHRRSMNACRELEAQYDLKQITNEREETDRLFLKKVEHKKGNIKRQVSNILKNVSDYKFRTFGEYSALLSCFNIEAKHVKGEGIDGKPFNGIIYSATDDTGKVVGNPFKSSLFGKTFGYEKLNKKMIRNEKELKEGKYTPLIRGTIAAAMKATRDKETFIELLKKNGIDVVFKTNEEGRIYGVTFIDHNRKEVYNGSALGKEFSANSLNNLLNNNLNQDFNKIEKIDRINETAKTTEKSEATIKSRQSFNPVNLDSDNIFDIFGIPFTESGIDYEEEALLRRTKRKRKKRKVQL
jgi:hypothetical protein